MVQDPKHGCNHRDKCAGQQKAIRRWDMHCFEYRAHDTSNEAEQDRNGGSRFHTQNINSV